MAYGVTENGQFGVLRTRREPNDFATVAIAASMEHRCVERTRELTHRTTECRAWRVVVRMMTRLVGRSRAKMLRWM